MFEGESVMISGFIAAVGLCIVMLALAMYTTITHLSEENKELRKRLDAGRHELEKTELELQDVRSIQLEQFIAEQKLRSRAPPAS
jgi:D-arabinose 1-dehydrogenase-like Zn-dependent alcohol dehydrogenase